MEAARQQAETANAAKSDFLANVSHELRTPLVSILGYTRIVQKRLEERIFPFLPQDHAKVDGEFEIDPELENKLRKSKLIRSQKGPGGGYVINKKPEDISVGLILNSLEGPVTIAQCLGPSAKRCKRVEGCVTRLLWKSLGEKIEGFLDTINLNDLLEEEARLLR